MDGELIKEEPAAAPAEERPDKAETESLVARAMRGNRDAVLDLCRAIARSVLFRTSRRLKNHMDAEDAAQEVLIRVCGKIRDLKNPKAFWGWLNSIIVNETNRYSSQSAKHGVVLNIDDYLETEPEDNEEFLPDEYVIREEDRRAVMEIVDRLPARQLEAVMLHYYDGLSVTETAEAMDVTKQSVSRYLALAREKIKAELQTESKYANVWGGVAFLPMGALLSQALQAEAVAVSALGEAWATDAVGSCANFVKAKKLPKPRAQPGAAVSAAATFAAATAVAAVMCAEGAFLGLRGDGGAPVSGTAVGSVAFSGGESGVEHLNPTGVDLRLASEYGEMTAESWKITRDGASLAGGEGGDAGAALAGLKGSEEGVYVLEFLLRDSAGRSYILSRSFSIMDVSDYN